MKQNHRKWNQVRWIYHDEFDDGRLCDMMPMKTHDTVTLWVRRLSMARAKSEPNEEERIVGANLEVMTQSKPKITVGVWTVWFNAESMKNRIDGRLGTWIHCIPQIPGKKRTQTASQVQTKWISSMDSHWTASEWVQTNKIRWRRMMFEARHGRVVKKRGHQKIKHPNSSFAPCQSRIGQFRHAEFIGRIVGMVKIAWRARKRRWTFRGSKIAITRARAARAAKLSHPCKAWHLTITNIHPKIGADRKCHSVFVCARGWMEGKKMRLAKTLHSAEGIHEYKKAVRTLTHSLFQKWKFHIKKKIWNRVHHESLQSISIRESSKWHEHTEQLIASTRK